jgi:triacylglycerol lipase
MARRPRAAALAVAAVLAAVLAPGGARAQMPDSIRVAIAAMGATLTPETVEMTENLYTPLARAVPRTGVRVTKNVSYGTDPRQVLDVYQREGGKAMPVVVFVHSGGFVAGDKDSNEEIYANVPRYFAWYGFLGINANYRLAPAAPWPAGAQDVGAVVAWAARHAAAYGGDAARIFLVGHAAGATHVASYVFDRSLQPAGGSGVAGAILLSGLYRVTAADPPPVKAYFGADPAQYAARSPLGHVPGSSVPVLIAIAEYDPLPLALPSIELLQAICQRDGRCPRFVRLAHHNHISTAASFNTGDETLGREILDFLRTGR